MPSRIAFALVFAFAFVAPVAAAEKGHRPRGDLAIKARAILKKYCADCHGETPAPSNLSVLDYKQLIRTGSPVPFVSLERAKRSQVLEFVEDGSMPPGGRDRPNPDEVRTLKEWVAASAPSFPKAFDDRTTLSLLL